MQHIDLGKPDYVAWRDFLRAAEDWTAERIADYQLAELQRMVRHAYENTVGYRALYDAAGVSPSDLRDLDDLRRFPCVDKAMIRADLEAFSVPMAERTYYTTSGSTDIPFGFYRDYATFARELASKAHQYRRIGWKEGDRQLVLRGQIVDAPDHVEFAPNFNELRCSSYHLTPEWMEGYYEHALGYRPEWVRCYPSSGYTFAHWLKATNRHFPPVKGVLCASENSYDFQKSLLGDVFGGRVFDHYGHCECAVLAGYCEHEDTYHVLPQYGYAELLDTRGEPVTEPGQTGEIVATSFIMHATPFIRYRTGDLATFEGWECPGCGRDYQVWSGIVGRAQEYLEAADGRHISMTAINFHDDTLDAIRHFQFRQGRDGAVSLLYVADGEVDEQFVVRRLAVKLEAGFSLEMCRVDEIPRTQRGKQPLVVREGVDG